jgi:hypothetical protein
MRHQKKLIAVLVSLACTGAAAQTNITNWREQRSDPCGPFNIAFINGIDTKLTVAQANLDRITQAYGTHHQGHLIRYVLGYNKTSGAPTDFYQASLKALSAYVGAKWPDYYNAVQSAIYTSVMPKTLATAVAKQVDDWYEITKAYVAQDEADILAALKNATLWSPGVRMVIVSHSEGNQFAVPVVKKLIEAGVPSYSIGAVGVAVPYFSIPTGNTYFTSSNDFVTDATQLALPGILPANVTIPYNSIDPLGHNFVNIYMADPNTRGKIVNAIKSEFAGLRTPTKLGSANTGLSAFHGAAWWADCTGIAPSGDPTKFGAARWPAGRDPSSCGPTGTPYNNYYVPMVFYRVAGQTTQIARAGDPGEVHNLATIQRDTCVAQAMGYYKTWVATGVAAAGTSGNCGSTYNSELVGRYRDMISGDDGKTISWSKIWTGESLGIGPLLVGGEDDYMGPTCRN